MAIDPVCGMNVNEAVVSLITKRRLNKGASLIVLYKNPLEKQKREVYPPAF